MVLQVSVDLPDKDPEQPSPMPCPGSAVSYYSFDGIAWNEKDASKTSQVRRGQTWILASEVRAQQSTIPPLIQHSYPSNFYNRSPQLPLSTAPQRLPSDTIRSNAPVGWMHHPLIPGQTTAWAPTASNETASRPKGTAFKPNKINKKKKKKPPNYNPVGGVRAVYNCSDPSKFDVICHDPRTGTTRYGRHLDNFAMARKHERKTSFAPSASTETPDKQPCPETGSLDGKEIKEDSVEKGSTQTEDLTSKSRL